MDLKLAGKRALVTGSSSGIGAAIANMLAAEGASVVIHGRNAERAEACASEIERQGGEAKVVLGDLAHRDGAAQVSEGSLAAFGGIDILVSNVGGALNHDVKDWFDISPEDWAATYDSNLVAAVRLAHSLSPGMVERGWGRIIHISSKNAHIPRTTLAAYAGAKAALNNMTISLSKALSRTGVTVNVISPGLIQTPLFDDFLRNVGKARGLGDNIDEIREWVFENMIRQTVKEPGHGVDIARVVAFLASPDSAYINGADFAIDGGAMPSA